MKHRYLSSAACTNGTAPDDALYTSSNIPQPWIYTTQRTWFKQCVWSCTLSYVVSSCRHLWLHFCCFKYTTINKLKQLNWRKLLYTIYQMPLGVRFVSDAHPVTWLDCYVLTLLTPWRRGVPGGGDVDRNDTRHSSPINGSILVITPGSASNHQILI